jgi:1-pyrroline-5-carboxylate dehydrogenase
MLMPYRPEPYVDFAEPGPREKMIAALKEVRGKLGRTYPLRIGDKRIETDKKISSIMPASTKTVVGFVSKANQDQAQQAIAVATETFKTWRKVDPETRARILFKAAAIMRRRVYELSAWECFEESKSWIEAYADVCEAIDFLEFYGREMVRLGGPSCATFRSASAS